MNIYIVPCFIVFPHYAHVCLLISGFVLQQGRKSYDEVRYQHNFTVIASNGP